MRRSLLSDDAFLVSGFCRRDWSPGRCASLLGRFNGPLPVMEFTPFGVCEAEPLTVAANPGVPEPGKRFDVGCGEDEDLTPLAPDWANGGGGRFIFGG